MARIVAGMASSHAFTLAEPEGWDEFRERNRALYKRRYGVEPPIHPKMADEGLEGNRARYAKVREALDVLRARLSVIRPEALILIGDDQNENFKEDNLPQIALYVGGDFVAVERGESEPRQGIKYRSHTGFGEALLEGLIDRGFDVSFSKSFPNSELRSHAHGPILKRVMPQADIPVVLLFVNAIHVPTVTPLRCYRLGQAMREILEGWPNGKRVVLYASGGLSHFTGGYPWRYYRGPHTYGSICEDFDRQALDLMARGEGEKLSLLSSQDLLDNGDIELRSWITLLGAVGKTPAQILAYEPFYRAIMGMAVAYWEAENV